MPRSYGGCEKRDCADLWSRSEMHTKGRRCSNTLRWLLKHRSVAAGLAGVSYVLSSCGGSHSIATLVSSSTFEQLPPAVTSSPTCTKPLEVVLSGPDNVDPYSASGARQRPGPGMVLTTLPNEPFIRTFVRPPDPDKNVAARQPDGTILTGEPGADPRPSTGATVAAQVLAQPEVVPCGAESGADEGGDL